MHPKLTILVPNFNRPHALARLLNSVFSAIAYAKGDRYVAVMVIDDYSTRDLKDVISPFSGRANFTFKLQREKCGNAELAFLSALMEIDTEYTWLIGNDDIVSLHSIDYILALLQDSSYSFILLNAVIAKAGQQPVTPIQTSAETVIYDQGADLFADWGFVTSTTTFPCLLFKTAPVKSFHRRNALTKTATVYSHTFTLFGAFASERCLFLNRSLLGFTLNERLEEQDKLQRQAPSGLIFYHQSLGLARLICRSAEVTGVPVAWFGAAVEDELDKDKLTIQRTRLSHFLLFFFLEQIIREQDNLIRGNPLFTHLNGAEWHEIGHVVRHFDEPISIQAFEQARALHCTFTTSPEWKIETLRRLQRDIVAINVRYRYEGHSSDAPQKLLIPNFTADQIRGQAGDAFGRRVS